MYRTPIMRLLEAGSDHQQLDPAEHSRHAVQQIMMAPADAQNLNIRAGRGECRRRRCSSRNAGLKVRKSFFRTILTWQLPGRQQLVQRCAYRVYNKRAKNGLGISGHHRRRHRASFLHDSLVTSIGLRSHLVQKRFKFVQSHRSTFFKP